MSAWELLLPGAVLCALMLVTHTYFGLHVLARGIIFVDLALAQVAVLGASFAFMLGYDTHGNAAHAFAFGAALLAGAAFAGLRRIPDKITREVTIGCVYVVATAITIVILSRSNQGMEELKTMLNGNLLFVRWQEILVLAAAYAALAALHAVFFRRFYTLSFGNSEKGCGAFFWELLFFASFALVITLGVDLAGVLLVFAYLIIPAFSAALVVRTFGMRWLLAVALGLAGSAVGLWLSFAADLPTGATLVAVLGSLPIITALAGFLCRRYSTATMI